MIEINLLPIREARRKADLQQQAVLLGATVLISVLLVGAYHWYLRSTVSAAHEHTAHLQRQIDAFGPQLKQVENYRATRAEMEQKLEVIETLDRSRSGPVHVLDELATHTPERVWLTHLETGSQSIVIEGVSLDNELVALFMTALGDSPYFDGVELEQTQLLEREGLKLNEFRIRAGLSTPEVETTTASLTADGAGR